MIISRLTCACITFAILMPSSLRAEQSTEKEKAKTQSSAKNEKESAAKDGSDGETSKVRARVVIMGPDGKIQNFDLNRAMKQFDIDGNGAKLLGRVIVVDDDEADTDQKDEGDARGDRPRRFRGADELRRWAIEGTPVGKYMIGVACNSASAAMRSQLKLGKKGLLVYHVREGSPAAKAGIQEHDVLVTAGGSELSTLPDLIKAVEDSKTESLDVKLLRGGESQTVEVTPVKRDVKDVADLPQRFRDFGRQIPDLDLDIEADAVSFEELMKLLESVRAADKPGGSVQQQLERLNQQIKQMQKDLERLGDDKDDGDDDDDDDDRDDS